MRLVLITCIISLPAAVYGYTDHSVRRFKDGFMFGAASAAYQVEGGWNEDGKGPSVWDHFFHGNPDKEVTAPGDVASDSYHNYKRDVEMLRELGVDFYRFSISWPRILPGGFSHMKNEAGLQYYDNLIDELLKYNIQPMVTMYHFDHPVVMQDLGGWGNPHAVEWFEDYARVVFDRYAIPRWRRTGVKWVKYNIQPMVTMYHFDHPVVMQDLGGWGNPHAVEWFEDYARVVFDRYAIPRWRRTGVKWVKYNIQPMVTMYHFDHPVVVQDLGGWGNPHSVEWFEDYVRVVFDRYASKVKYWITVNQPNSVCEVDNHFENQAPRTTRGIMDYLCVKNIMLAHARVYRLYEKEYKKKYGGSVGISISVNWGDPLTNSTENVEAAETFRDFAYGMYLHPIWSKSGDFPKRVKDRVALRSKEQGFFRSRLPTFSKDEITLIKGSADFLGLNHYTTFFVSPTQRTSPSPSFADDLGVDLSTGEKWLQSHSPWLKSAPYGLYKVCLYLNKEYDYPRIIITENGWSTDKGLQDKSRSENIQQYLKALLLAIEDGTEVVGYTYWSLMDNVEWMAGTSERFGLYEVDFDSPARTRTARQSALAYKRIIYKRIVEEGWTPNNLNISIMYEVTIKQGKKRGKVEKVTIHELNV